MESPGWVLLLVISGFVALVWYSVSFMETVRNLCELFQKEEERWWYQHDLGRVIHKPDLLVRFALSYLGTKGLLKRKLVFVKGIKGYTPEGKEYPVLMSFVQLDHTKRKNKRKRNEIAKQMKGIFSPLSV